MSWKDVIIKHVTRKAQNKTAVSYYLFVIFSSYSLFFLCFCSFGLAKKIAPLFQTPDWAQLAQEDQSGAADLGSLYPPHLSVAHF